MKRLLLSVLACASLCACTKDLENRVDAIEKRLAELETKVNENADGISKLVAAAAKAVTVTSVESLSDGYTIHFSDGTSATIKNGVNGKDGKDGVNGTDGKDGVNGADGEDGHSPVVGVKEEDGVLYWTVDGEFILDKDGQKVPVTGKDGQDGKTPQFKIEDGVWKVSFDGENYTEVTVSGTVNQGIVIEETETEYIFTLGETVIRIAKEKAFAVSVASAPVEFDPAAKTLVLAYTVTGEDETTKVFAESAEFKVIVDATTHRVCVTVLEGTIKGEVLVKAVRNSDSKYSAQHVTIINNAYGTHGGKIVIDGNEYTEW